MAEGETEDIATEDGTAEAGTEDGADETEADEGTAESVAKTLETDTMPSQSFRRLSVQTCSRSR